jgi:hypothetical protein
MIMSHFHSFFTWRNADTALLPLMTAAAILLIHVAVHGFSPFPMHASVHEKYNPTSTRISDAFSRTHSPAIVVCASIKQQTRADDDDLNKRNVNVTGVTLKMAFDQNWAVADDAAVTSKRFTSPSSLDLVHVLRRASDAVLVGKSTVQRDNCTLTVRRVPLFHQKQQPVRVVIDPNLSLLLPDDDDINKKYALFQDGLETIVYCRQDALLLIIKKRFQSIIMSNWFLYPLRPRMTRFRQSTF